MGQSQSGQARPVDARPSMHRPLSAVSEDAGRHPCAHDPPDSRRPSVPTAVSSLGRHLRRQSWLGTSAVPYNSARPGSYVQGDQASQEHPSMMDEESALPQQSTRASTTSDSIEAGGDESPPSQPDNPPLAVSRLSYLSRLGARLAPRYSSPAGPVEDDTDEDVRAVRRRLSDRLSFPDQSHHHSRARRRRMSSIFPTLRAAPPTSSSSTRGHRHHLSISQPMPVDAQDNQSDWSRLGQFTSPTFLRSTSSGLRNQVENSESATTPNARPSPSRSSRLSRVRHSIFNSPPPAVQERSRRRSQPQYGTVPFSESGSRLTLSEQTESFLSRMSSPRLALDIDDSPLSPPLFSPASRPHRARPISSPDIRALSDESRTAHSTNPLRRTASRFQRSEDQAAMLSRLLSVAAAATAASLVGNTERAFSEAQDVGGGSDGTFDGFLQALQNGSLAAALRNGGNEMGGGPDAASPEGNFTPVNFFRMFRFASTTEDSSSGSVNGSPASGGNEATTSAGDGRRPRGQAASVANERDDFDAAGGRMVPVIIVGIRSVMPRDGTTQDDAATPPLFDALSNLPLTMPNGLPRGGSGTLMRRTDRRSRFSRDRRASMSAVNPFPANYDSQRHQRMSASAARTLQDSRPFPGSPLPTVLSDSPPGPHPPPSTPADHGLSAMSSATNTPSRRPSSASVNPLPNHALPRWRESGASAGIGTASSVVEDEPPPTPSRTRRRRLSDSEFSRYRDFGSGSSRRNGIVGDSEVQPNSSASRASNGASNDVTRSWIIYVLGGSYPEDHPILTTPSLFTDSPTYEDMLLLSSLLGVAKPPVATREEVASAPGVYRVTGTSDGLVAENVNGDRLQVLGGERCLVCLCDYEIQEEIRQLTKCGHTYHRECIDEWLTTGRNSCPLCRGQGVDENSKQRTPADPAASTANTPS